MRFFTFLKQYISQSRDEDISTFYQWIENSGYIQKNPHAGIVQISLFVKLKEHTDEVWVGFVKTCLAYQKQNPESLPLQFRKKENLLAFLGVDLSE